MLPFIFGLFNIAFTSTDCPSVSLAISESTPGTCPDEEKCPVGSVYILPSNTTGHCVTCSDVDELTPGLYCLEGEPEICPKQYYCPTVTSAPILCPSGSFCRAGFSQPVKCIDGFEKCPEGSDSRSMGIDILIYILILIAILSAIFVLQRYVKKRFIGSSDALFEKRKIIDNLVTNFIFKVTSGLDIRLPKMQGFTPDIRHAPISLEFFKLTLKLKNETQKIVLDNVSGEFPPGSIVAIMGPSGCGKSSFMNAISNRAPYGEVSGDIFIDGCLVDLGQCPKLVGFVPQDDIVHEDLTVFYNLYYSAMLRLPKDMPTDKKKKIVEDVILILDLESIKNTIVGSPEKRGISGGQKKRVNIGMELVAYPRILFLDEPTSGLDSSASLSVVNCLNRMKSLGITVVCVIHQPRYSIFRSFSHVLLLGKGGRTVYLGDTGKIHSYFTDLGFVLPSGENVADWFIDIVSGTVPRINPKTKKVIPTTNPNFYLPALWKRHASALLEEPEETNVFTQKAIPPTSPEEVSPVNDENITETCDVIINKTSSEDTPVRRQSSSIHQTLSVSPPDTPLERMEVFLNLLIDILGNDIDINDLINIESSISDSTPNRLSPKQVMFAKSHERSSIRSNILISSADLHSICCSLDIGEFTMDDMSEFLSLLSQILNIEYVILVVGGTCGDSTADPLSAGKSFVSPGNRGMFSAKSSSTSSVSSSPQINLNELLKGLVKLITTSTSKEVVVSSAKHNNPSIRVDSPRGDTSFSARDMFDSDEDYVESMTKSRPSLSIFGQVVYLCKRNVLKFNYNAFLIFMAATFVAGVIQGSSASTKLNYVTMPGSYAGTLLIYSVVVGSANLHVFGKDKMIFYRENGVGVSVFAYWLSKNIVNIFEIVMLPFAFCTAWYMFTRADLGFGNVYFILLMVTLYINAASYVFAIVFTYPVALLFSVVVPCLYMGIFGGTDPAMRKMDGIKRLIAYTGPGVYAIQLFVIFELESLSPNVPELEVVVEMMAEFEIKFSNKNAYISYLFLVGFVWRLLSLYFIYLRSRNIYIISYSRKYVSNLVSRLHKHKNQVDPETNLLSSTKAY